MKDTQGRLNVDDDVIWTSPATGQEIKVNYRGAHNGCAIIWTGTMQLAVPIDQIRSAMYYTPETLVEKLAEVCHD